VALTLRRAALLLALLIAAGVFAQVSGAVTFAAGLLGLAPERIGLDAGALLTPRKVATAVAFALVTAAAWGLLRRDAGKRLVSGIPPMSPAAAGAFRIAFAAALLWAVIQSGPVEPGLDVTLHRNAGALANWPWAHALAAHGTATLWLYRALLGAVVLFGLGIVTRVATVGVAALATLNAIALLQRQSAHDWGLPVVALWLLALAPLGDALSVDALVRRWRGRQPPQREPQQYGLAVWIPGLALGLALFAAAFAKIDTSGLAWITDGAVRYHFIEDSYQAPTDWGLRIASNDILSVIASLAAVFAEAAIVVHVFFRSWRLRFACGVVATMLLLGFFLLQGVLWRLWWVLLVAFVPWEPIVAALTRRARGTAPRPASGWALHRWQVAVLALVVLQQVVFSSLHLELEPFASDYGMYSFTWTSREAFEAHLVRKRKRVRTEETPTGTRIITEEPVFDWSRGRFGPPRIVIVEEPRR
jgi:hypothetical protein